MHIIISYNQMATMTIHLLWLVYNYISCVDICSVEYKQFQITIVDCILQSTIVIWNCLYSTLQMSTHDTSHKRWMVIVAIWLYETEKVVQRFTIDMTGKEFGDNFIFFLYTQIFGK